jgi:hypothetical protein
MRCRICRPDSRPSRLAGAGRQLTRLSAASHGSSRCKGDIRPSARGSIERSLDTRSSTRILLDRIGHLLPKFLQDSSSAQSLGKNRQADVHSVVHRGVVVGKFLVGVLYAQRDEPFVHAPGAVDQVVLIDVAAVDVQGFQC